MRVVRVVRSESVTWCRLWMSSHASIFHTWGGDSVSGVRGECVRG